MTARGSRETRTNDHAHATIVQVDGVTLLALFELGPVFAHPLIDGGSGLQQVTVVPPLAATVAANAFVVSDVQMFRIPLGNAQLAMDAVGVPADEIE